CLRNSSAFVALKLARGEARRRECIPAILDRLSNEAPGQFQRNPECGMSFERRRRCSLLTEPLRDMLVDRAGPETGAPIPRFIAPRTRKGQRTLFLPRRRGWGPSSAGVGLQPGRALPGWGFSLMACGFLKEARVRSRSMDV